MSLQVKLQQYFPYRTWRRFQREIAELVYRVIVEEKIGVIEAPTGLGKTAAVLAGALTALDEVESGKLFFLVKTKNEAQAPYREVRRLPRPEFIAVFRNKREMCGLEYVRELPYEEFVLECRALCSRGLCPYAKAVEELSEDELWEIYQSAQTPTQFIRKLVEKGYCPYEVSKWLTERCRVIVGSYHYIFSTKVRYAFLTSVPLRLGDLVLVIDEAHNLPQTIMEVESSSLSYLTVRHAITEVKKYVRDRESKERGVRYLKLLEKFFRDMRRKLSDEDLEGRFHVVSREEVLTYFEGIHYLETLVPEVTARKREAYGGPVTTALKKIVDFYRDLIRVGRGYELFLTCEEQILKLVNRCVDPSIPARSILENVRSCILLSATMPPTKYLTAVLGLPEEEVLELRIRLRDYVPGAVYCGIYTGCTTRYSERSEEMYRRIAEVLTTVYEEVRRYGAVLAVCPSYTVLRYIRTHLDPGLPLIVERYETSIDEVLEALRQNPTSLILAVAGGKIVEGVEFRLGEENVLKCVVIVGVPYPEPDDFTRKFYDYLSLRVGDRDLAWDCTFLVPAVTRVKQAIGRALRSERDRVLVLLLDYRFREEKVLRYLEDVVQAPQVLETREQVQSWVREVIPKVVSS